jgi:hypothetical protein
MRSLPLLVLFGLVAWTAAGLARAQGFDILQEEKFCPGGRAQARPVDNVTALVDSVKEKVDVDVVRVHYCVKSVPELNFVVKWPELHIDGIGMQHGFLGLSEILPDNLAIKSTTIYVGTSAKYDVGVFREKSREDEIYDLLKRGGARIVGSLSPVPLGKPDGERIEKAEPADLQFSFEMGEDRATFSAADRAERHSQTFYIVVPEEIARLNPEAKRELSLDAEGHSFTYRVDPKRAALKVTPVRVQNSDRQDVGVVPAPIVVERNE